MKNYFKKGALVMAAVMAISSFAGCGKSEQTTDIKNGAEVVLNGDKIYPVQCEDTLSF